MSLSHTRILKRMFAGVDEKETSALQTGMNIFVYTDTLIIGYFYDLLNVKHYRCNQSSTR